MFCVVLCWLPSRCVQTAIGLIYLIPMWATGMQKVPKLTKDDVIKVRGALVVCSTTSTHSFCGSMIYIELSIGAEGILIYSTSIPRNIPDTRYFFVSSEC